MKGISRTGSSQVDSVLILRPFLNKGNPRIGNQNVRSRMKRKPTDHDPVVAMNSLTSKPAMFFRENPEGYLREVEAISFGFCFASGWDSDTKSYRREFFPDGFVEFVSERIPQDKSAPYWGSRLVKFAGGELEAWKLFVEFWKEFNSSS